MCLPWIYIEKNYVSFFGFVSGRREWFPPARAAVASFSFRTTRAEYASNRHDPMDELSPG